MPLELPKTLRKVGGLWQRTSGRGHVYFSGGSREQKFYAFANPDAGNGQPDYIFYVEDRTATKEALPAAKTQRRARKPKRDLPPVQTSTKPQEAPFNDQLDDLFPD